MNESTNKLIKTVSYQFRNAIELLINKKPNINIRGYEEDYCYIIDNIERDALCNQPMHLNNAKKLIEGIIEKANGK